METPSSQNILPCALKNVSGATINPKGFSRLQNKNNINLIIIVENFWVTEGIVIYEWILLLNVKIVLAFNILFRIVEFTPYSEGKENFRRFLWRRTSITINTFWVPSYAWDLFFTWILLYLQVPDKVWCFLPSHARE